MDNWNKIEFIFAHKLHISPIDLQQLEYYRIYYMLKEYEDYIQKENEEYQKHQREADKQTKMSNQSFGGFKVPKFDVPKFDVPKI